MPRKPRLFVPGAIYHVYCRVARGEFVFDDNHLIKNNQYIKSGLSLANILIGKIKVDVEEKYSSYRPITMLTFAMDYSLWGLNERGYHVTNTILHILVALAIYWLISIFYRDNTLALLTGLLFVAHPIHTEAVAYVAGRGDSLAALFVLLCIIFYIK